MEIRVNQPESYFKRTLDLPSERRTQISRVLYVERIRYEYLRFICIYSILANMNIL